MRSLPGLRGELDLLEEKLGALPPEAAPSPGAALMQRNLREVRDELRADLEDARRARLDVVLEGVPVAGHEVRVDALAKVLRSLQEAVSSVAQAITGKATSRASIPGPLRDATSLRLAAVFPGSFGAVLRGPLERDGAEQPLFELDGSVPTLLDEAVGRLLQIIALAAVDDPADSSIIDAVLPLGARSFKHLNELAGAILDEEMSARLSFASPSAPTRRVVLNRAAARSLSDALGRNRLTEDQEVMVGHLGTVSDIRNRIELQTEDRIIAARVIDELVPQLADFYSRRVTATFDVTLLRSLVTGEERRSYVLVGLALTAGSAHLELEAGEGASE